jgi:hypothetical protein
MLPGRDLENPKQKSRITDGEEKFLRTAAKYVFSLMDYTTEINKSRINKRHAMYV